MANLRSPWDEYANTEELNYDAPLQDVYQPSDFSQAEPTPQQPPAPPEPRPPVNTTIPVGGPGMTFQGNDNSNGGGNNDTEARLKASLGSLYTPGALEEVQHHDYDPGWYNRIVNKELLRGNNEPGSTYTPNGQGGYMTAPARVAAPSSNTGGRSGSSSSSSGGGGMNGNFGNFDLRSVLGGLFPGGAFNNDVYTKRVSNASDTINRFKQSQLATDKAALAERGLIGSGPEQTAYGRLGENIAGIYGNAVTGIEADEAQKADDRMMRSLELATGMTEEEARNAIAQFNAETNRTGTLGNLALGQGQLALGNLQANNQYTLGLGNLGLGNYQATNTYNLGRDTLSNNAENQRMQHIIDLLGQGLTLEQIRAMGYI